jgi:hypothetical protein
MSQREPLILSNSMVENIYRAGYSVQPQRFVKQIMLHMKLFMSQREPLILSNSTVEKIYRAGYSVRPSKICKTDYITYETVYEPSFVKVK